MTTDTSSTTLFTCAQCGEARPAAEYDRRFLNKNCKITCATCRGLQDETTKWQQGWANRRKREAQWIARLAAEEKAREREREEAERLRFEQLKMWYGLQERGFSDEETSFIFLIHALIRDSGLAWAEIKRRYNALTPPYMQDSSRLHATPKLRAAIYAEQQGHCLYCNRQLLSLDVWKRGSREGRSVIDRMSSAERHNRADSGIPELDHKIPISRGGSHGRENLCYACRKCNQLKGTRTKSEFALYPHDSISELGMGLPWINLGIQLELRGYSGFDAELPFRTSRVVLYCPIRRKSETDD